MSTTLRAGLVNQDLIERESGKLGDNEADFLNALVADEESNSDVVWLELDHWSDLHWSFLEHNDVFAFVRERAQQNIEGTDPRYRFGWVSLFSNAEVLESKKQFQGLVESLEGNLFEMAEQIEECFEFAVDEKKALIFVYE